MKRQPYTYLIRFKPKGWYYFGSRYSKDCHPNDLWVSYFTSSKVVKALIQENGVDSFEILSIVEHNTTELAREFEELVLVDNDAAKNPMWINKSNGGTNFHWDGGLDKTQAERDEINRKKSVNSKGHKKQPFTQEHCEKISKNHKGMLGKKHSEDTLNNMKHPHKQYTLPEKIECPYCGKKVKKYFLDKYHLDNCRLSPNPKPRDNTNTPWNYKWKI